MENTGIKGIYAVKVGQLWVRENYGNYELNEVPKSLMDFKAARKAAIATGGVIYEFTPSQLTSGQIETLNLVSGVSNG